MKKTKATGQVFGAKKQFVLQQGEEVPAAEVVKRAKAVGLKLTPAYVYVLRSEARRGGGGGKKTGKAGKGATRAAAKVPTKLGRKGKGGTAAALAALAIELGLQRATELLNHLRSQARNVD